MATETNTGNINVNTLNDVEIVSIEERLAAARKGDFTSWILHIPRADIGGIMDCYKSRGPDGMVYTAYLYADGYMKIIDDRLINHTASDHITTDRMFKVRVMA